MQPTNAKRRADRRGRSLDAGSRRSDGSAAPGGGARAGARRAGRVPALLAAGFLSLGLGPCGLFGEGTPLFHFRKPLFDQLSLDGPVDFALKLPPQADVQTLVVRVDGRRVDRRSIRAGRPFATGTLTGLAEGAHRLEAEVEAGRPFFGSRRLTAETRFETVALESPDTCEILNGAHCLLPYPSSRFLERARTRTGVRIALPASGMPENLGEPASPEPYTVMDGFSPTQQVLMHFPGGVDLERSDASRLLESTRSIGLRSLHPDSPSVLLDATTGERVLHFLELDARAEDPAEQVVFLRPGRSLVPGHRYIVAVRGLRHPDGSLVEAEPVFAALRDRRPSDIPALRARRVRFERMLRRLERAGVPRDDLQLAFRFRVGSDENLTGQMLSMRDRAFEWLSAEAQPTFTVEDVTENECTPDAGAWRIVRGTYRVPLFLESDPEIAPRVAAQLSVDADGEPQQTGFTHPPFTVAIPCSARDAGGPVNHPLVIGHGLFGTGRGTVEGFTERPSLRGFDQILGGTDFRGLSGPDIAGELESFIVSGIFLDLDNFAALPDRLRQGQLNTLVLARMMKRGHFNAHPAFQRADGSGVFPGAAVEQFYFGASLGGIMGTMFAALSPDVTNVNVDVPAMNFSILLERSTQFLRFEPLVDLLNPDRTEQVIAFQLLHELGVRGEPAGYARHVTSDPLPGTNAKNILMTVAFLDHQVSNQATEIAARTLELPSLVGSLQSDLPLIEDRRGPLDSALVVYDTGSFDLSNPLHEPFIPPLANLQPEPNRCDPHGLRAFIPASLDQLAQFLRPGGQIENFCNGRCNAAEPLELPFGADTPCDPLAEAG